jgi:phasin family protein
MALEEQVMRKTRTPVSPKPARGRRVAPPLAAGAKRKVAAAAAEPAVAAPPPVPRVPVAAAAAPAAKTSDDGHGAFAAMMRSGALLAEGLEGIGRAWIGVAQATMHDGAATARAMIGAKSPQQVLELQANYARATLDRLVAESGKLPALSVGVANRAIEPIQSQLAAAVDRLWRRAA